MPLRSRRQDQPILQVPLASRRRSCREARRAQVQSQERAKIRLQRGFGLCLRDARLQASEHAHPPIQAIVECVPPWRHLRFHHHRDEHLRGFADVDAVESLLRHADDREGLAVDDRLAADYGPIGREPRAPVRVREHRDRMTILQSVIVWRDHATDCRANAKHGEVGARDDLSSDAFGPAQTGNVEVVPNRPNTPANT